MGDLGHDGKTIRIERQWYREAQRYTKSANGMRTISLPPALAEQLWARSADATGPMFATRTGQHLSDRNLRRTLEKAVDRAAISRISLHSFRDTHGSILLDEAWPITEVAHRLGDDVQTVARTHAHKLRDSDRSLDFLDALGNTEGNKRATEGPSPAETAGGRHVRTARLAAQMSTIRKQPQTSPEICNQGVGGSSPPAGLAKSLQQRVFDRHRRVTCRVCSERRRSWDMEVGSAAR